MGPGLDGVGSWVGGRNPLPGTGDVFNVGAGASEGEDEKIGSGRVRSR